MFSLQPTSNMSIGNFSIVLFVFALSCLSCSGFQPTGHISSSLQQQQRQRQPQGLYMAGFGAPKVEKESEVKVIAGDSLCTCGSTKKYDDCCQPLHTSIGVKETGEGPDPATVLRSRFSALCNEMPFYLAESTHPAHKDYVAKDDDKVTTGTKRTKRSIWEKEFKRFTEAWEFKDLEIIETAVPTDGADADVSISLQRKLKSAAKWDTVNEKIRFRKTNMGKWAFVSNVIEVKKFEASMVGNVKGKGLSSFTKGQKSG
jgi:uncharacterized protein YchJ